MRHPALVRVLIAAVLALAIAPLNPASAEAASNGRLTAADVAPIADGIECPDLGGQLRNDAAAAYNTLALEAGRFLSTNGCDSAYRTYERQVWWRSYWCGQGHCENAAYPGTSNHGLGLATDVPEGTYALYLRYPWAGFRKVEAFQEPWHWNFVGSFTRPDPGTNIEIPILRNGSGGPGQGEWVRKAQKRLRAHGYRDVHTDGEFGRTTRRAVTLFQKEAGLPKTGVVRKGTWKALHTPPVVVDQTDERPDAADAKRQNEKLHLSEKGADFVAHFEGTYLKPYNDPVGHCTVGTGHLIHLGNCTQADYSHWGTITQKRANRLLRKDAGDAETAVKTCIDVGLDQAQFDALVDAAFNLGQAVVCRSGLQEVLNAQKFGKVREQLKRWVYAGGQVLAGLVRRRESEADLFERKDYVPRPA